MQKIGSPSYSAMRKGSLGRRWFGSSLCSKCRKNGTFLTDSLHTSSKSPKITRRTKACDPCASKTRPRMVFPDLAGITLHDPAHNLENGPVTLVFFRALEAVAHWQRAERQGRFLHCAWIPCQEGHHGWCLGDVLDIQVLFCHVQACILFSFRRPSSSYKHLSLVKNCLHQSLSQVGFIKCAPQPTCSAQLDRR